MNCASLANWAGSPYINRPLSLACKEMWSTPGSGVEGGICTGTFHLLISGDMMVYSMVEYVFSPGHRLQWVWVNGSHILYVHDPLGKIYKKMTINLTHPCDLVPSLLSVKRDLQGLI